MNKLFIPLGYFLACFIFFQGCSTTESALNPERPHIYLNSYQEVIDGTDKSLQRAGMRVYEAEEVEDGTYFIRYYKQKYDSNSERANPEGALMAEITIEKMDEERTRVTIKEEKESNMVPAEYREKLGRNVLRQMTKVLNHESSAKQKLAQNGE